MPHIQSVITKYITEILFFLLIHYENQLRLILKSLHMIKLKNFENGGFKWGLINAAGGALSVAASHCCDYDCPEAPVCFHHCSHVFAPSTIWTDLTVNQTALGLIAGFLSYFFFFFHGGVRGWQQYERFNKSTLQILSGEIEGFNGKTNRLKPWCVCSS